MYINCRAVNEIFMPRPSIVSALYRISVNLLNQCDCVLASALLVSCSFLNVARLSVVYIGLVLRA